MTASPGLELSGPLGRVLTYCSGGAMRRTVCYLPLSEAHLPASSVVLTQRMSGCCSPSPRAQLV